ncbi:MAG: hypothetical protein HUJ63_10180 [Enterococcus sp.]|nr:hypothetical protein [Enterococcus sp.]
MKTTKINGRFSVLSFDSTDSNGNPIKTERIVVKDIDSGIIVGITDFDKYIFINRKTATASKRSALYFICNMLNYLFSEAVFGIDYLSELTIPDIEIYASYYSSTPGKQGFYPKHDTISRCIHTNLKWIVGVSRVYHDLLSVSESDLFYSEDVRMLNGANATIKRAQINAPANEHTRPRKYDDLSKKQGEYLLKIALEYDPPIGMGAAISMYSGVRIGGVCNMVEGPEHTIRITRRGFAIDSIEIDLRENRVLREDGTIPGSIKIRRTQQVFTPFRESFAKVYEEYVSGFLRNAKRDSEYMPLIPDKRGNAMTSKTFRRRFKKFVLSVYIPALKDETAQQLFGFSPDEIAQNALLAEILTEQGGIHPHALRHWYSVQVAINSDMNPYSLMYWRGDRNIQSSITYLTDHGEISERLDNVHDTVINRAKSAAKMINDVDFDSSTHT